MAGLPVEIPKPDGADFNASRGAFARVLECIGQEIEKHLFEEQGVALTGWKLAEADFYLPAFLFGAQVLQGLTDQLAGRDGMLAQRLAPQAGKCQQSVD
jgi:hypothetical protein